MTNGRTSKLIDEVKAWAQATGTKQTDLASSLGVSPQLVTDWFKGRKFPVGEQVLHLQELMRSKHPKKPKR